MTNAQHVLEFRVRYSETDQMRTYYNSRALEWFERGRTELLRAMGKTYREMERLGVMLPVTEAHVEFLGRAEYDDLFADHPRHEVIYEQLTRDLPGELRRIQEFLGVPYEPVNPGTEKRPSRTLAAQIANYTELKDYFRATPAAAFFTE